jgi:hypothetical protein
MAGGHLLKFIRCQKHIAAEGESNTCYGALILVRALYLLM